MDSESSPSKKGSKNSRRGKSTTTSRSRGRGRGKRAVKVSYFKNYSASVHNNAKENDLLLQLILSDDEESDREEEPSPVKTVDVENEKPPKILTATEITIKHPECK